jgi:hypothetical protein
MVARCSFILMKVQLQNLRRRPVPEIARGGKQTVIEWKRRLANSVGFVMLQIVQGVKNCSAFAVATVMHETESTVLMQDHSV